MKQIKASKTELLELNDALRRVLFWFFAYPDREVSLSDLTRLVSISKTTANKIVTDLASEKFLKVSMLGKLWRISCEKQHVYNTTMKIPYNLELVYTSGVLDAILKLIPNPRSIILYGSYRKGDDIENSDLDIAVETLDDEEVKITTIGTIQKLGFRENVKVNMLKFSRNKIDLNLFANIANGIILYGFFEARP